MLATFIKNSCPLKTKPQLGQILSKGSVVVVILKKIEGDKIKRKGSPSKFRFAPEFRSHICLFPGEIRILTPEVAVTGGLLVDRA